MQFTTDLYGGGGYNKASVSFRTGVEKSFAWFSGHEAESDSWRYPGAHIGVNTVYGEPFSQNRIPYNHFELGVELTTNIESYQAQLLSDAYIFSFATSSAQKFTSTGLTMHYDFFNATNVIIDNTGYGNIQFSSNAFDWSVKHANFFSVQAYTVIKAHAGFTVWGTSMYNGNVSSGNYLGNTHGTYGAGENLKLFFTVSHNKAGTLELAALGYHIFSIPVTPEHSTGNVFFIDASIKYDVPITRYFGIGVNLRYWKLLGLYDSAENVYRALISTGVYLVFFTEK